MSPVSREQLLCHRHHSRLYIAGNTNSSSSLRRIKANSAALAFTLLQSHWGSVTVNTSAAVCVSSHRPRPDAPVEGEDLTGHSLTGLVDTVLPPSPGGHLIELYGYNLLKVCKLSSALLICEAAEGQILPVFPCQSWQDFYGAVRTLVRSLFGRTHTEVRNHGSPPNPLLSGARKEKLCIVHFSF